MSSRKNLGRKEILYVTVGFYVCGFRLSGQYGQDQFGGQGHVRKFDGLSG